VESYVAVIRLKELPVGFRVISTESALIESVSNVSKQFIRESMLSNQTDEPEVVCCEAVFEAASIESLPEAHEKHIRHQVIQNLPDDIYCVALYTVDKIDVTNNCSSCSIVKGCIMGEYSELSDIREEASVENSRQNELIQMLNKEL
jgi:hypothetical protein